MLRGACLPRPNSNAFREFGARFASQRVPRVGRNRPTKSAVFRRFAPTIAVVRQGAIRASRYCALRRCAYHIADEDGSPASTNLRSVSTGLAGNGSVALGEVRTRSRALLAGNPLQIRPARILMVSATMMTLKKKARMPCPSAMRRRRWDSICTSDTWNVMPMTNEK
jgi:hypothetical protein